MHAFVDESRRSGRYLMCAVLVAPGDLPTVRRGLVALRLAGQRRLHLNHESPPRRRLILDRVARLPIQARTFVAPGSTSRARQECLRALALGTTDAGVTRLVLESVGSLAAVDCAVLDALTYNGQLRADLTYEHVEPRREPALWAADAVAWAVGAGGDWRRRVAPVMEQRAVPRQREARADTVR